MTSVVQLFLASSVWIGIFMCWSLEYSLAVPFFHDTLSCSKTVSNLMWAAGPISGFLIGPIVGSLSDSFQSPLGRRRPFILSGAIITCVVGLAFAISPRLGSHTVTFLVAFVCFWLMDMSLNVVQNPSRALVSDIAEESQQVEAQAITAVCQGMGQLLGPGLVSLFAHPLQDMIPIYVAGLSVLALTACITAVFAKEKPTSLDGNARDSTCSQIKSTFSNMLGGLKKMPGPLRRVALVQVLTWLSWFTYNQVLTDFFGSIVLGGDAEAPKGSPLNALYEDGVRMGSRALMGQAAVCLICGFGFPLLKKLGTSTKLLYGFSLGSLSLVQLSVYVFRNFSPWLVVGIAALSGIGYCGTQAFPYSLAGLLVPDKTQKGLAMGALTVCIVVPQLLDVSYIGAMASAWGVDKVVLLGSFYSCAAAICTAFLIVPGEGAVASQSAADCDYDEFIGDDVEEDKSSL